MHTTLSSRSSTVVIGHDQPFCVIGERINPTGRKTFAEELRGGDLSTVTVDALAQVQAGADMLDVNAGIPLVDESELLAAMLRTVAEATDVPICIDSSVIEALEAGLAVYEGKALVNSVTGEDERLEEILPLVARHGAAVIGLANDETGIPETPQQRLDIARKIVSAAGDHGIPPEDVVIDPLAMTVGAATDAVTITLETISLIRDELGVNMCLGASNVSFGLPRRHQLGAAFLPMAMAAGLTSAIMSCAEEVVNSVRAADLLLGHDEWGARWIAEHREREAGEGGGGVVSPRPQLAREEEPMDEQARRRRRRARAAALPARRHRGARAERDADLRRRELERHRHRLDVRRPRHVPQVQGAGAARRTRRSARSTRARSAPRSSTTAGAWPAARPRARTWWSASRRCRRGPRRRWSASGAT